MPCGSPSGRDPIEPDLPLARKTICEPALVVSRVRLKEPSAAFERWFPSTTPCFGQCDGPHRITSRSAFAQSAAFQVAGREVHAHSDGIVHLIAGEAQDLRRGDGGAEDAENRAR